METKTRVLIADSNQDFCKLLTELLGSERDLEAVGCAEDGLEALSMVMELKPELVIMDLVLPKLDGLELLRRLPETGCKPHVIVLSGFVNNKVVADCSANGADYFIPKPCEAPVLLAHIRQIVGSAAPFVSTAGFDCRNSVQTRQDMDLEAVVTDIIHEIGVPAHIKGYQYLREAIILTINDMDMINAVTKVLYPAVAHICGCNKDNVERCIRTALGSAWKRQDKLLWQKYFPNAEQCPSNSVFISRLAEALLLEEE